jgi:hypothetical protein
MPQAMRQVGTKRRHDASTEAPGSQAWYALVAPAGVENDHRCRPDETIHRERHKPGGSTRLAV